ncbi:MAG: hypothetical protein B5M53_00080 [Candidatus Cloacimonas sp. 4484_209]|nr:MAG: hypothetical protein B5M53_00080 [Candidatus Cloacimonas sp. 4484_209]
MYHFNINIGFPELAAFLGGIFYWFLMGLFAIFVIIICSFGYRAKRDIGWFLLLIYGIIRLITQFSNLFFTYFTKFFRTTSLSSITFGFSIISSLFTTAGSILLITGLFMLLKNYLSAVKEKQQIV